MSNLFPSIIWVVLFFSTNYKYKITRAFLPETMASEKELMNSTNTTLGIATKEIKTETALKFQDQPDHFFDKIKTNTLFKKKEINTIKLHNQFCVFLDSVEHIKDFKTLKRGVLKRVNLTDGYYIKYISSLIYPNTITYIRIEAEEKPKIVLEFYRGKDYEVAKKMHYKNLAFMKECNDKDGSGMTNDRGREASMHKYKTSDIMLWLKVPDDPNSPIDPADGEPSSQYVVQIEIQKLGHP